MPNDKDPRQARLRREQALLETVNRESEFVKITAVAPIGGAPERYMVSFSCRGIVGIDGAKNPIYGDNHEVEIYCDSNFPADVPRLRWVTPIWHPNIRHKEPKDVCVNRHEWLSGMYLDHLCWQMFDMVQYKNYHAEPTEPFPLDHEAAQWVLEFAEPRGIVNRRRGISVDNRPFLRRNSPVSITRPDAVAPAPRARVKFASPNTAVPQIRPVTSEFAVGDVRCRACGLALPPGGKVCVGCGTPLLRVRFA